jgi:hypothetical protein
LVLREPQAEDSFRAKALRGQGEEHLQIADGPHGGKIERWGWGNANQVFEALTSHLDLSESTDAGGFLKEGSLLRYGLEQGDGDSWSGNLQGQAREARATADVEQAAVDLHMPGEEKAFAEMARHTLFRIADRGEVDFLVPAEKQVKVGEDLVRLSG